MSFPPPKIAGTKRNANAHSSHASSSQQHHNRVAQDMDSLQMSVSEVSVLPVSAHIAPVLVGADAQTHARARSPEEGGARARGRYLV